MNEKFGGFIAGVATLIELGCMTALAVIAMKRNNDCYEAECKLLDTEYDLLCKEVEIIHKDHAISMLEKELEELKDEAVEES